MGYDLNGKRYILSVNVIKYIGINRDRNGSENDERNIIDTFKVRTQREWKDIVLQFCHYCKSLAMMRIIKTLTQRNSLLTSAPWIIII